VNDPTPLGDLIGSVLQRYGVARPDGAMRLLEEWKQLAPPAWAERGTPVSLRDGTLDVEVADGGTASLLRYQQSELIAALEGSLGAGLVTSVRIRVRRSAERSS
jgi:hypothetical protein